MRTWFGAASALRVGGVRTSPIVAVVLTALVAAPAVRADTTVPTPPAIAQVATGPQVITLYFEPGAGATRTEYSLDNGPWSPCPEVTGACTVGDLKNGRRYIVRLRSVGDAGVSEPSAPASGTPTLPVGVDPDKPATVSGKVRRVTARFDAAGNIPDVSGASTRLGVGTLPSLTFSAPISQKAAVERHLVVTSTDAEGVTQSVPGAWGWIDDRTTVFRPERFWPAKSSVVITSTVGGVLMGRADGRTLVGASSLNTVFTFATGRAFVAQVDGATKTMRVWVDGDRVKDFRVSLGGPDWETRNGVKVFSTAKEPYKVYRSESLGITDPEEAYELPANWNTRLTPSGEFIHAAPWAYGRLGRYNGSHGCTNMFEQDAKWIFDTTIPGDVVVYKNTGGSTVEPWNGPGGLWNIPWRTWLRKSALGSGSNAVDTSDLASPAANPPVSASA